jgi:hypothetical protein
MDGWSRQIAFFTQWMLNYLKKWEECQIVLAEYIKAADSRAE